MNDSLNISSLEMEQLYEPESVVFTFETIGWDILFGVVAMMMLIGLFLWGRKYIKNAYRRKALTLLKVIEQRFQKSHDVQCVTDTMVVVKQVAISAFGRGQIADLFGMSWLLFLEEKGKRTSFTPFHLMLENALYKNEISSEEEIMELFEMTRKWIKTHA